MVQQGLCVGGVAFSDGATGDALPTCVGRRRGVLGDQEKPMALKLAFAGGLRLSWRCLKALCENGVVPTVAFGYDAALADRRGYCDLGDLCEPHGIEYHRIRDINTDLVADRLSVHAIDLFLVWNWSQLVRGPILSLPKLGCLGMHPTKLPLGRGRAPIPWSIIQGVRESAISIFFLTPGVDDGDLVLQFPFQIGDDEDATSLYGRLESLHESAVAEFCRLLKAGPLPRTPQDHAKATVWKKRQPSDGVIDWHQPAEVVLRWIRALTDPYPGAFTTLNSETYFLWRADRARGAGRPGEILAATDRGAMVACGEGAIDVLLAQKAGAERRSARELVKDQSWPISSVLGGANTQ